MQLLPIYNIYIDNVVTHNTQSDPFKRVQYILFSINPEKYINNMRMYLPIVRDDHLYTCIPTKLQNYNNYTI